MLNRRLRVITADGFAAIPGDLVPRALADAISELVEFHLWEHRPADGLYVFLHPGSLYSIVDADGTPLAPTRKG
jgi:hypothetical protein